MCQSNFNIICANILMFRHLTFKIMHTAAHEAGTGSGDLLVRGVHWLDVYAQGKCCVPFIMFI